MIENRTKKTEKVLFCAIQIQEAHLHVNVINLSVHIRFINTYKSFEINV